MIFLIYVLFLSIWTINCLNTSESDGSSTIGAKQLESMESKMDNFRRHLLIIIIGVMIIAFVFTCFCFLHYNCMNEDAHEAGMDKDECIEDKSAWPSRTSFSESRTENLCSLEKHSMLSSIEKLSGPSSPEKSSIPSSAEKLVRSSGAKKLCRPQSKQKLIRSSTHEKSFLPFCAGLYLRSSHLEKSCKTYSLEKSYKLAHAHKIVSPVSTSYPDKPVSLPWPASGQSSARLVKSHFLSHPQNQILLSKPLRLRKSVKAPRHLKRSISIGKTVLVAKPLLAKTCQCYREKCLVCKTTSETLVHISESKKENAGNLFSSSNMKSFTRSFQKVDSKDDVYGDNVSDGDNVTDIDMMTYDSDDSEREIIIICNIRSNHIVPYGTSKK
ncbi:uncharacterized protein CXorf66 homolog [Urocitellus parryii]|uniref:uncharacterized protein CXorf66 homolog n=1 Tax=Urocitellus parryii TaxID=9999 RepID=UPI000E55F922|nr:uncharacterized protein CXorf66 homolog [Urocitellus parryii]